MPGFRYRCATWRICCSSTVTIFAMRPCFCGKTALVPMFAALPYAAAAMLMIRRLARLS